LPQSGTEPLKTIPEGTEKILLQASAGLFIAAPSNPVVLAMLQEIIDRTANVPEQLAFRPFDVPQAAVTFILLYVPVAGLLQLGALVDQAISDGVFPLLQVKTGEVISKPENPFAGTEPQASVAGLTFNEPLQLAVKPLEVPQVAVALIPLYVPVAGLLQFGAPADQAISVAVLPLLQVKAGGVISAPSYTEAGTLPQVSVAGLTFNVPQETAGEIPCPQSASANTS
jgi:hypothetical protein